MGSFWQFFSSVFLPVFQRSGLLGNAFHISPRAHPILIIKEFRREEEQFILISST